MASEDFIELRGGLTTQNGHGNGVREKIIRRTRSFRHGCTVNVLVSHAANCIGRFSLGLGSYGPVKTTKDDQRLIDQTSAVLETLKMISQYSKPFFNLSNNTHEVHLPEGR